MGIFSLRSVIKWLLLSNRRDGTVSQATYHLPDANVPPTPRLGQCPVVFCRSGSLCVHADHAFYFLFTHSKANDTIVSGPRTISHLLAGNARVKALACHYLGPVEDTLVDPSELQLLICKKESARSCDLKGTIHLSYLMYR